ncbi:MAG: CVNH domain-containing protein [Nostoc sp.]|uniref:CVNH domain-containing protein n=1 Tax=Nostoc sp. TaxID=1180 RepID=UPI002FF52B37
MKLKFWNLTSILSSAVISLLSPITAFESAQAGPSSYQRTCHDERIYTVSNITYLYAVCRNVNGLPIASQLQLLGINNKNGKLIQNPLVGATSFFSTCTAIKVFNGKLSAYCLKINGQYYANNISLEEITNYNGYLGYEWNKIIQETADKIGHGHAYFSHANEFNSSSHSPTMDTMSLIAADILSYYNNNAANRDFKTLQDGRAAYWGVINPSHYIGGYSRNKGTIVIINPSVRDMGTMFVPLAGKAYFYNLR